MMNNNIGKVERWFRLILGVILLALLLTDSPYRYWGLIGIIPIATALIGTCPLYSLLGINKNK